MVKIRLAESDPVYKKVMELFNVNEVLFQCLILDDIWEYDGMICAKLYTIYTIN